MNGTKTPGELTSRMNAPDYVISALTEWLHNNTHDPSKHMVRDECDYCRVWYWVYGDGDMPDAMVWTDMCSGELEDWHAEVAEDRITELGCYICDSENPPTKKIVDEKTVNKRQDPTRTYKLECGHWII
jgi:hypothetical protein